jgi:hypothetical protein
MEINVEKISKIYLKKTTFLREHGKSGTTGECGIFELLR